MWNPLTNVEIQSNNMSLSICGLQINRLKELLIGEESFDQRRDSIKQHVAKYMWTPNQQVEGTIDRCGIL
jgi:hypothetical protein